MSEQSLARNQRESTERRRQAQQRFEDASEAYFLLADTGCPPEKLERVGLLMDRRASEAAS